MTVGVSVECEDGAVLACDSLSQYGRGVPIQRHTNKIDELDLDGVLSELAIATAGSRTYYTKFKNSIERRKLLEKARKDQETGELDIIDFAEDVCEAAATNLYKEYTIDRAEFLGNSINTYDLSLIIAGKTHNDSIKTYFVHPTGLSEPIETYGSIGSGAAYAELFMRFLMSGESKVSIEDGAKLAVYAIKGVELMDPNVGGKPSVKVIKENDQGNLEIDSFPEENMPTNPKAEVQEVLSEMNEKLEKLVG